jgi:pilus assembly protein CpaE
MGLMRTLIVNHNLLDPLGARLKEVLRGRVDPEEPAVARYDDVEHRLPQLQPEMLVVVLSPDPERGLDAVRKLRRHTVAPILAVGLVSEPKLILRALHDGADLYLDEAELESGLDTALARFKAKTEAAPAGRLVTVLSCSGGSGASTLAVNIATVLAREHQRCALIDLKPGRGDLAALLDLKPIFTLADLCLNVARLDRAMFEKVLVAHASGVYLLGSPQVFGGLRVVTTQGVGQALTLARKHFPHVVADVEDCFHEEQALALRQATVILLICRMDFTSLRNARRILDHLTELEVPESRIRLIANRSGQPGELPQGEAETALGRKIFHGIPDDPRTINVANNTGIPVVIKSPSTRVAQSIVQMTRLILERRRNDRVADPILVH